MIRFEVRSHQHRYFNTLFRESGQQIEIARAEVTTHGKLLYPNGMPAILMECPPLPLPIPFSNAFELRSTRFTATEERVALFHSLARGDARHESDYDVAVLNRGKIDEREITGNDQVP